MAEWKKVLMLLLFHCGIVLGRTIPSNYSVRLSNGLYAHDGRVEIYYNGKWGTVCDDNWDLRDGHVVCRQLGYANAIYVYRASSGSGPIWLDEVNCTGSETLLYQCQHNGWRRHNCMHWEDAGVMCRNSSKPSYSLRLAGGSLYGRVEIQYNGIWGKVCSNLWDINDANVACHQLGYANAIYIYHASYSNISTWHHDINCTGSETALNQCQHNGWIWRTYCWYYAGIICRKLSAPSYSVQLMRGTSLSSQQGRVEIQYNGIWGTVCRDMWDMNDANVVCHELGFEQATRALTWTKYGQGSGPIWLNNVKCNGSENRLADCVHSGWGMTHNCYHWKDAGVECTGVRRITTQNIMTSTSIITTEQFTIATSYISPTVENSNIIYSSELATYPESISTSTDWSVVTNEVTPKHQGASDNRGGMVIGGVAGGVIGTLVILIVGTGALLAWTKWKKRKRNSPDTLSPLPRQFNNAIYGEGFEYADVGPAPNDKTIKQLDVEYSYAIRGASEGAIYEEAQNQDQEENIYVVPPGNKDELYSQLDGIAAMKLSRNNLSLGKSLGSGQFGAVYKSIWRRGQEEVSVAVKTLKEGASDEDRVKFLQEAAIMGQFKHTNVVTMYGVIKDEEPILLVLELLANGDLRGHLLKSKSGDSVATDDHTLLSYCRQVVSGMVYLSNKSFVHRDLAARNILVTQDERCKIADFGMSRDLLYESFYTSRGGMIPVKWTAPEALHYRTYSIASDVWSFGVVMYEIWSVGHKPFETMNNNKVLSAISSGVRLAPPPGCPRKIYRIMMECWHPESSCRPSFVDVSRQLSLPDSKLLVWCEEDIPTQAHTLGEQLHWGQHLYTDLQNKYIVK